MSCGVAVLVVGSGSRVCVIRFPFRVSVSGFGHVTVTWQLAYIFLNPQPPPPPPAFQKSCKTRRKNSHLKTSALIRFCGFQEDLTECPICPTRSARLLSGFGTEVGVHDVRWFTACFGFMGVQGGGFAGFSFEFTAVGFRCF